MSFLLKAVGWKGTDEKKPENENAFFPTVEQPSPRPQNIAIPTLSIPPKTPTAGGSSVPSTPSPSTPVAPSPLVSPRTINTDSIPLSPRKARTQNTRVNMLKQASVSTSDKTFAFDDKNKFLSFKEETYIPMAYAKDKLQQVLADWTQMKQEYITAIEDIDSHYKQQDAEQLSKMKEFVKEYQSKYKALREKHNEMKEHKNKEIADKVARVHQELAVTFVQ
jgi:hypothetical protein